MINSFSKLDIRSIYTQQQSFRDVDDFCLHCICKVSIKFARSGYSRRNQNF